MSIVIFNFLSKTIRQKNSGSEKTDEFLLNPEPLKTSGQLSIITLHHGTLTINGSSFFDVFSSLQRIHIEIQLIETVLL